ncbi:MAG TPA: hypothetical protein VHW01_10740 [Polyangiaceae bacterium]|jgi:hypothetical protein|nr:hypothetical protein [Polyangiaceae bacterium]
MVVADSISSDPTLSVALSALRETVRVDLAEFRREVGWRLPSALESASVSDIRQHLGPFLEHTFRNWAERESREVQEALAVIAERVLTAHPRAESEESLIGPDSRLTRPTFDVSTFAIDAGIVAALALGVGTLFANVAVGGLFLLAAPTLASFGRGRGERALRRHAAESALRSVDEAVAQLGAELERVIDDFSLGIVD